MPVAAVVAGGAVGCGAACETGFEAVLGVVLWETDCPLGGVAGVCARLSVVFVVGGWVVGSVVGLAEAWTLDWAATRARPEEIVGLGEEEAPCGRPGARGSVTLFGAADRPDPGCRSAAAAAGRTPMPR